jgi:hypothetical protein
VGAAVIVVLGAVLARWGSRFSRPRVA